MFLDTCGRMHGGRVCERLSVTLSVLLLIGTVWGPASEQAYAGNRTSERGDSLSIPTVSTIAHVRVSDQPGVLPDLEGDTVTVRGRISAERGVFPDSTIAFLQDQTAGIAVQLPREFTAQRGDLLRIEGIVRYRDGLTYLEGLRATEGRVLAWMPDPMPATVATVTRGNYQGRLVRLQGTIVSRQTKTEGRYLLLTDGRRRAERQITVFVPPPRDQYGRFNQFTIGDEIHVTGVLSRHPNAPSSTNHIVFPRDQNDFEEQSAVSNGTRTIILFIVGGTLFAVIALMTLQSAVRRRNQQLIESRARFRQLAEATHEGIILHRDGTILDVNRALTTMTGYKRDDLVDRSFPEVLSESVLDLDREMLHPRSAETYETVVVRQDGSTFPATVDERIVSAGDDRVRVVAIRDITEQKRREAELRNAKEEAEQMAQLKSTLLNNMSHEFRTPITSILGYADLILEEPDADHQDFAQQIHKSGKRLSRTLQAVLEMAQIESGQITVQTESVDVGSLTRDVVDEYREAGPSFEITGTADIVETDRRLFRRVLENLIQNAAKFTPDTGHVTVALQSTESSVEVSVRDSGVGIDPAFQDDLFSPFKQESTGRTRTHEGMGLGLSLTKRMLDLLDATIDVESEKGEGSTFTVRLPASFPTSAPSPSAETADPS